MRATGYTDRLLLTILLLFVVPVIAFPANPQVNGGVLNPYEHFLGSALGLITPYITQLRRLDRLAPTRVLEALSR
jgi:hypothetical protein